MLNEREQAETYCCTAEGTELRRNALRRQIGAEKSFNPTVNEAEECSTGRESIPGLGWPSEVAANKYPHQRNGVFMENLQRGALAYKMMQLEIMHPRWRNEFV